MPKIIILTTIFSLLSGVTNAEVRQGYSYIENNSDTALKYSQLENNEYFDQILSCYNQSELSKISEIKNNLKKQSSCFNSYNTTSELNQKINSLETSIKKLNLYKEITNLAIKKLTALEQDLNNNSTGDYGQVGLALLPKGEIYKENIERYTKHEPLCKINKNTNLKTVVQSHENTKLSFLSFNENTKIQNSKIIESLNNLNSLSDIINKEKISFFDSYKIKQKTGYLLENTIIIDPTGSELVNQYQENKNNKIIPLNEIVTYVTIDIENSPNKTISINIKNPNLTTQQGFNINNIPTEKMIDILKTDIIPNLNDRMEEYQKILNDFSKKKQELTNNLDLIKKNTSCFIIPEVSPDLPVTKEQNQNTNVNFEDYQFQRQTLTNFSNGIINRVVSGAKFTFSTIADSMIQLVKINPFPKNSPNPTP